MLGFYPPIPLYRLLFFDMDLNSIEYILQSLHTNTGVVVIENHGSIVY